MVQASSSLLWPRSSVRKPSNNEETGDNGQMQDMMHSSGRAGSTSDSAAQDASYTQFSHANGPSPHDPAHKGESGLIVMQAVGQVRQIQY